MIKFWWNKLNKTFLSQSLCDGLFCGSKALTIKSRLYEDRWNINERETSTIHSSSQHLSTAWKEGERLDLQAFCIDIIKTPFKSFIDLNYNLHSKWS